MKYLLALSLLWLVGCVDPSMVCAGADRDGDGVPDACDNCPYAANPEQTDANHNGAGDRCDVDDDGDGVLDPDDGCPWVMQGPDALDSDADGLPNACDICPGGADARDTDSDGVNDCVDTCFAAPDATNADRDGDGVGDVCDNCPDVPNFGQNDADRDRVGDACDAQPAFSIVEASIADTLNALERGEVTCTEVVEAHLSRIARHELDVSSSAPYNAMTMLNASVREQASALDTAFAQSGLTGPLHCIVFAVKTNYGTTDTEVTNGSLALRGVRRSADAESVRALREAGAVLIGATGMDEFASGVYGIGSSHGRTGNAYSRDRNSGGSSAGSAVAVAASFAQFSMGTDNCASLILPAAYNGLVSMRSTRGLIDVRGLYPSNRLDLVAGPMTRSVTDLAVVFDVVVEPYNDAPPGWTRPESYGAHLVADGLNGRRVGLLRKLSDTTNPWRRFPFDGGNAVAHRAWYRARDTMQRLGADVVDNVQLRDFDDTRHSTNYVRAVDDFLAETTGGATSFSDICKSERFSVDKWTSKSACLWEMRGARLFLDASSTIGAPEYDINRAHIHEVMDALNLDVLAFPVDARGAASYAVKDTCIVSSVSGVPTITVPVGLTPDGMPIGITLLARAWDEATLFEVAFALEQAIGARRAPPVDLGDGTMLAEPVDIDAYNQLHARLADEVFERYLKHSGRDSLTASAMREVTAEVLEAP